MSGCATPAWLGPILITASLLLLLAGWRLGTASADAGPTLAGRWRPLLLVAGLLLLGTGVAAVSETARRKDCLARAGACPAPLVGAGYPCRAEGGACDGGAGKCVTQKGFWPWDSDCECHCR